MGKVTQAAAEFQQGAECLKPLYLRMPQALNPLMEHLVRAYIGACENAGVQINRALLSDIMPQLFGNAGESTLD